MLIEIIKLLIYSTLIILIAKYVLVKTLRSLAENLKLKPKIVGEITGYATSIPEFLTICVSSLSGLNATTVVNIVSSNTINVLQYIFTVMLNKNGKLLKNKALQINLVLVIITILIPIILLGFDQNTNVALVPIFILLYFIFKRINTNAHNKYLKQEEKILDDKMIEEDARGNNKQAKSSSRIKQENALYIFVLFLVGVALFFIGNNLGDTLENLANRFNISETILGILLGVVTSIPELITFLESQKHYKKKGNNNFGDEEAILGVVEASNNLITSNLINLFIILTLGIVITNIIS